MPPSDACGDAAPASWEAAYPELKKIARARLHASRHRAPGLNTTAPVHERFLRLAGRVQALRFDSRGHVYTYATRVRRSVIVDLVRERQADRRGGGVAELTLNTVVANGLAADGGAEPLRVDEALTTLAAVEPRLAQVVALRYFAGLSDLEIAQVLGLTDRTVRRDWDKARLLQRSMPGCCPPVPADTVGAVVTTALPCAPEHGPAFSRRLDALLALPADAHPAALNALPDDEAFLRP